MAAAIDTSASDTPPVVSFADLGVSEALCAGLAELGFTAPTPIQAQAIPTLLQGRDIVGQAQTGTGKTAAFGLPMLQCLDLEAKTVQGLVLAPTRELARQVTEALSSYATQMPELRIVTVYGGAPYRPQLRALSRGVHVVVGTPGRVIDCIERGALVLDQVRMAVLDEADEMLRMGFIDDVETILDKTPESRQLALFSATMPRQIRRIAEGTLQNPATISVQGQQRSVDGIEQRAMILAERDKQEALVRILEAEQSGATLVFARTQVRCQELAEALDARGLGAAPLHGGLSQQQREDVVRRLREERIQLVVATDVAARGLDVDGITHVINYDPPQNAEIYLHRIGRTGRAGRQGVAILMLTPRDRRVWSGIERFTKRKLTRMQVPSNMQLAAGRKARYADKVRAALESEALGPYRDVVEQLVAEGADAVEVATAMAFLANEKTPFEVKSRGPQAIEHKERPPREHRDSRPRREYRDAEPPSGEWTRLFISLGSSAGIRPGDLVGAVANELGISGKNIGAIDIRDRFSFFEVASEHAERVIDVMGSTKIRGRKAGITLARPAAAPASRDSEPTRGGRGRSEDQGRFDKRAERSEDRGGRPQGGPKKRFKKPLPHKRRSQKPFGGPKKKGGKKR